MNCFTFETFNKASESDKASALNTCSNVCEHVKKDPNKLFIIHTENDLFKCERSAFCKECDIVFAMLAGVSTVTNSKGV